MRLLLIKPNVLRQRDRQGHQSSLLLGLLSIASYVGDPDRLRIAVYPDDKDFIENSLPWADAVGFSAFTAEYESVRKLARRLRRTYPDKLYFIGGYHVTLTGAFDGDVFDFAIIGEGEKPVRDLVEDRLVPRKGGELDLFAAEKPLEVDEIPLIDYRLYPGLQRISGGRTSLVASRGCAFSACRFCTSSRFHRGLRRIPPKRLAIQMEMASEATGSRRINLWDDNFSDDPTYVEEVVRALERKNLLMAEMSCFARLTLPIEKGIFAMLRRMGAMTLVTGFESGSNRVLKYLKGTRSDLRHTHENCLRARGNRLEVLASVMLGVPTETVEEMRQTLDLLRWKLEQKIPGAVWVYVATPLPGSEFWDKAIERGSVSLDMDFDKLAFDSLASPLLLDPDIPRETFADVISRALELAGKLESGPGFDGAFGTVDKKDPRFGDARST